MIIPATVFRTDVGVGDSGSTMFNATPYFEQASDALISHLFSAQLHACPASDRVAWWMRKHDEDVRLFFWNSEISQYDPERPRFSVMIDEPCAIDWLRQRRPQLYQQLRLALTAFFDEYESNYDRDLAAHPYREDEDD